MMKIVDLAQYLHELRFQKTGRAIGAAMSAVEVLNCVESCTRNGISRVEYHETELPRRTDGFFVRLVSNDSSESVAAVYVNKSLPQHWREFVVIKEMMHCWSPGQSYVGTPGEAKQLIRALYDRSGRYSAMAAADQSGILAATEVILPHYTVERHIAMGHDVAQIAAHHSLHPEIAEQICRIDFLFQRKSAKLG